MQQKAECQYDASLRLEADFIQQMGYCNRTQIPDELVQRLAEYCDTHVDEAPGYYAADLVHQFFRKRTGARWTGLLARLDSHLQRKRFLIEIADSYVFRNDAQAAVDFLSPDVLWAAVRDYPDGYAKANLITSFADRLSVSDLPEALSVSWALPPSIGERALAGLYAHVPCADQDEIFTFLMNQSADGSGEASLQLRSIFRHLTPVHRRRLVAAFLSRPDIEEVTIAFLAIQNADGLLADEALGLLERIRTFKDEYLRIRALAKLERFLPQGEIGTIYDRFLAEFNRRTPTARIIHNLYHLSNVDGRLSRNAVITLALNKIACFDDTQRELYLQDKYCELSFLTRHLESEHMAHAFAIASDVRGRYKQALLNRLHKHYRRTAVT